MLLSRFHVYVGKAAARRIELFVPRRAGRRGRHHSLWRSQWACFPSPLPTSTGGSFAQFSWLIPAFGLFHFAIQRGSLQAQEVISDEDSDVAADANEAVPAPAPLAAAPAPSPIQQAAQAAPRRRSYLTWLYESLGLLYSVIFLGLSFSLVAVFVMNVLVARRDSDLAAGVDRRFRETSRSQAISGGLRARAQRRLVPRQGAFGRPVAADRTATSRPSRRCRRSATKKACGSSTC